MIGNRWLQGAAAGVGAAAAAVTAGLVVERRVVRTRRAIGGDADVLGSLRGEEHAVRTEDGVMLYAEIDEVAPYAGGLKRSSVEPTIVFVHGYALNLDCWHFQREYFRGKHRMVFYDQRSHGRSGRSDQEHASIDQLGDDLRRVVEDLVPRGPVVLVGHSMGGMSILAFAERHPEVFEARVAGVALVATTAGGLKTDNVLSRFVPNAVGARVAPRVMAGLALAPRLVDGVRRRGSNIGFLVASEFAFGEEVPASYVEFVNNMLAQTPFEVLAQFYPHFNTLDKFTVLERVGRVPTSIVIGSKDVMTSIGHSRRMAERMPNADLVEVPGGGHMVIMEKKDRVNAALDQLFAAADATPVSPGVVKLLADTAEETRAFGRRLAGVLRGGDLLVLSGDLGAGKTTFTQGLGLGLGVRGDVTSPTFVISRVHPSLVGGPALVHVDAYRLGGLTELDDLDLDTSLDEAVTVVEWGVGVAEGLAEDRLEIDIRRAHGDEAGETRTLWLTAVGSRWAGVELTSALGA